MAFQPASPPSSLHTGTPLQDGRPTINSPIPGAIPPADSPDAPGTAGVDGSREPAVSFLQRPWVQTVLPFVTSLTVHAGILILGIVAVKLFASQVVSVVREMEQTIVAESTLQDKRPGDVPNVGLRDNPFTEPTQEQSPDSDKQGGWAKRPGPTVDIQASAGSGENETTSLIGLGIGGPIGSGPGSNAGGGTGDGSGPLARFGAPGGGAIGPRGPVFGDGGKARRIVFVCDATGSMLNKMATLRFELENAVSSLKPSQSFNIVFYYDGPKVQAADMGGLLSATPDNKRNAFKFLDNVTATGQTDPIPAIQLAFRQKPDLIYLLSDGGLDDNLRTNKEVTDEIDRLNPGRKVTINTIMFDGYQEEAEAVMSKIANDTGGKYRYVKESDLNQ